jgi:hypothetical protein
VRWVWGRVLRKKRRPRLPRQPIQNNRPVVRLRIALTKKARSAYRPGFFCPPKGARKNESVLSARPLEEERMELFSSLMAGGSCTADPVKALKRRRRQYCRSIHDSPITVHKHAALRRPAPSDGPAQMRETPVLHLGNLSVANDKAALENPRFFAGS